MSRTRAQGKALAVAGAVAVLLPVLGLARGPGVQAPDRPRRRAVFRRGGASEARYRVREQLAGVSLPNDAVGATRAVEGAIAFDGQGRVLTGESRFNAPERRAAPGQLRPAEHPGTDRHPLVVFVPAEARGLPVPLPAAGAASFELAGDLTVREATRRITWAASATFAGGEASVRAQAAFRFGDFLLGLLDPPGGEKVPRRGGPGAGRLDTVRRRRRVLDQAIAVLMRRFGRATERSSRPGLVVSVRRVTAAGAVLALTLLRGAAAATPTDPLWIPGVYDAGDWDDHVQSITLLVGAPGDRVPVVGPALPSAESIEPTAATGFAPTAVATLRSRAPPIP